MLATSKTPALSLETRRIEYRRMAGKERRAALAALEVGSKALGGQSIGRVTPWTNDMQGLEHGSILDFRV